MNDILHSHPLCPPHLLQNPRLSPNRSRTLSTHLTSHASPFRHASSSGSSPANFRPLVSAPNMPPGRKRKADDDQAEDERMSSPSPSLGQRQLPTTQQQRNIKRARTNLIGRPLPLPRLLETLGEADMRSLLRQLCDRHPAVAAEVVTSAPRPSVASAIAVLHNYEAQLRAAFPFGPRNGSDYAYNRVRTPLLELLDALKDYTPHFLPPNETTPATSLGYLDQATDIIHRLQMWDNYQNNRHKFEAYEEIARAWAVVIREAAKRGSGIQLQYGGWDRKLREHNEVSGGKMSEALEELRKSVEWGAREEAAASSAAAAASGPGSMSEREEIRQQLLNGTFGLSSVQVGPW